MGPFDMPRCFCDINNFTEDCGGDGVASGWVASESDPDMCYDWSLSSVVYPLPAQGRLAPVNYPSARVFLFNGFSKYVTAVTPGSGQLCTGTMSFITGSSYSGTLIITATGTIPTFRVDNGP